MFYLMGDAGGMWCENPRQSSHDVLMTARVGVQDVSLARGMKADTYLEKQIIVVPFNSLNIQFPHWQLLGHIINWLKKRV